MKKIIQFLCLLIFIIMLPTQTILALSETNGAIIDTNETLGNQYDKVLYYPNAKNESVRRFGTSLVTNWRGSDGKTQEIITLIPKNEKSLQFISESLEITMNYTVNRNEPYSLLSLEELKEKKLSVYLYNAESDSNFIDITNELKFNTISKTYTYDGKIERGFKLIIENEEMPYTPPTSNVMRRDVLKVDIISNLAIDTTRLSTEKLSGEQPLEQILDTKFFNALPTPNTQDLYVISPKIDGFIKTQELENKADKPQWEAGAIAPNINVALLETIDEVEVEIARTKTNEEGYFLFSNIINGGEPYYVSDSKNVLSIKVEDENSYNQWIILDEVKPFSNILSLGKLTDISRFQNQFQNALLDVNFRADYVDLLANGEYANNGKYMLTFSPTIIKNGNVVVHYVDTDMNKISENVETSGIIGSEYSTSAKDIDGYNLVEIKGIEVGNYIDGVIEVTYIYEKNSDIPSVDPPSNQNVLPKTGESENGILVGAVIFLMSICLLCFEKNKDTEKK